MVEWFLDEKFIEVQIFLGLYISESIRLIIIIKKNYINYFCVCFVFIIVN